MIYSNVSPIKMIQFYRSYLSFVEARDNVAYQIHALELLHLTHKC